MSVRCRDIMALPALSTMRLVAGEQGLDRIVKWIYFGDVIDDLDESPEWINGHELVVYSGTGYSGTGYTGLAQMLTQVFYKLNNKNIAGFIINVGPYISEIPPEAIAVANELKLPLFRLPWEVKLVNLTHAICNLIISSEMRDGRVANILEGLLFEETNAPEELERILYDNRLTADTGLIVGVCVIYDTEAPEHGSDATQRIASANKALQSRLDDAFAWGGVRALNAAMSTDVVFLTPNLPDTKTKLSGILQGVTSDLAQLYPGLCVRTGLSVAREAPLDLKKNYRQAKLAAGAYSSNSGITSYDDMGLLSLLLDIDDASVLRRYYNKTLGVLVEYDRINRTDLYHTLSAFYENDGDLQNAARGLYIHKNTLKYRLNRICDILGCNIRLTKDFVRIGVALQAGKILDDKAVPADE